MSPERLVAVLWVVWLVCALRLFACRVNGDDDPEPWQRARMVFWLAFVGTAWWWVAGGTS